MSGEVTLANAFQKRIDFVILTVCRKLDPTAVQIPDPSGHVVSLRQGEDGGSESYPLHLPFIRRPDRFHESFGFLNPASVPSPG